MSNAEDLFELFVVLDLMAGLPREADVIVVGQEFVTDGVIVNPTYTEAAQ